MCGRCTRKGVGTSSQLVTAFVSNMKISLGKSEFKTSRDSGQSPSNATEFFFYTALKKNPYLEIALAFVPSGQRTANGHRLHPTARRDLSSKSNSFLGTAQRNMKS